MFTFSLMSHEACMQQVIKAGRASLAKHSVKKIVVSISLGKKYLGSWD